MTSELSKATPVDSLHVVQDDKNYENCNNWIQTCCPKEAMEYALILGDTSAYLPDLAGLKGRIKEIKVVWYPDVPAQRSEIEGMTIIKMDLSGGFSLVASKFMEDLKKEKKPKDMQARIDYCLKKLAKLYEDFVPDFSELTKELSAKPIDYLVSVNIGTLLVNESVCVLSKFILEECSYMTNKASMKRIMDLNSYLTDRVWVYHVQFLYSISHSRTRICFMDTFVQKEFQLTMENCSGHKQEHIKRKTPRQTNIWVKEASQKTLTNLFVEKAKSTWDWNKTLELRFIVSAFLFEQRKDSEPEKKDSKS